MCEWYVCVCVNGMCVCLRVFVVVVVFVFVRRCCLTRIQYALGVMLQLGEWYLLFSHISSFKPHFKPLTPSHFSLLSPTHRMRECLQMQSVLNHPAFQANPTTALHQHLLNSTKAGVL